MLIKFVILDYEYFSIAELSVLSALALTLTFRRTAVIYKRTLTLFVMKMAFAWHLFLMALAIRCKRIETSWKWKNEEFDLSHASTMAKTNDTLSIILLTTNTSLWADWCLFLSRNKKCGSIEFGTIIRLTAVDAQKLKYMD